MCRIVIAGALGSADDSRMKGSPNTAIPESARPIVPRKELSNEQQGISSLMLRKSVRAA
jgi:hypothetical protein